MRGWRLAAVALLAALTAAGCADRVWNNPYPAADSGAATYYSSFDERPKHLDPARSYSSNEAVFTGQIFEPPLQYHFLKRPYELVPLTSVGLPQVRYLDAAGNEVSEGDEPAFSEYLLAIQPGILYQPHPAFATEADGDFVYRPGHPALASAHTLSDFTERGSRELTAEDYVYQIKRLAFPAIHSPIAGLMGGHIEGFEDFSKTVEAAYATLRESSGEEEPWFDLRGFDMKGVEAYDRYGLRIRLVGRYPQFPYWLAMPFFAPMPWEADRFYHLPALAEKNITLDWFPVGTGPYMLTENNPNLRMVLEKNPLFHGERYPAEGEASDRSDGNLADAGRPVPFIERAVYSLEKESIPRWSKFLQGYYDVSGVSSDSFDQAVSFGAGGEATLTDEMMAKGIRLSTATETSIYFMGFNMRDPVVGGDSERARLLRRAVSIAVDMEEYISIFRNERGLVAQGPLPPGIFGYRDGIEGINPYVFDVVDGKPVRKSVEEARKLMAEAGYAGGIDPETGAPLTLYYDTAATGPDAKALLNWYRKQFEKLGIQLVIRSTDYNRFQDKMRKGTAQIFSWGWNADYPDPENFLFLLHGPQGKVEYGGENGANYQNEAFDALFERMKNMPNGPERQTVVDDMLKILWRDAPWSWGFFPVSFSLHHEWYDNTKVNLMANNTLKYRRVDPARRAELRDRWNQPLVWPLAALGAVLLLSLIPAVMVFRRRERSAAR